MISFQRQQYAVARTVTTIVVKATGKNVQADSVLDLPGSGSGQCLGSGPSALGPPGELLARHPWHKEDLPTGCEGGQRKCDE